MSSKAPTLRTATQVMLTITIANPSWDKVMAVAGRPSPPVADQSATSPIVDSAGKASFHIHHRPASSDTVSARSSSDRVCAPIIARSIFGGATATAASPGVAAAAPADSAAASARWMRLSRHWRTCIHKAARP